jgi:guanylate kinase
LPGEKSRARQFVCLNPNSSKCGQVETLEETTLEMFNNHCQTLMANEYISLAKFNRRILFIKDSNQIITVADLSQLGKRKMDELFKSLTQSQEDLKFHHLIIRKKVKGSECESHRLVVAKNNSAENFEFCFQIELSDQRQLKKLFKPAVVAKDTSTTMKSKNKRIREEREEAEAVISLYFLSKPDSIIARNKFMLFNDQSTNHQTEENISLVKHRKHG